ncbi:MAG: MarR family transcriptional regulator [Chloroflexi bacterium]|jgi:DNA-binding MarR family transcriptional regulator|nr:MAG: MarR family transcriptional regulator [Chloroflexota bacterium]
MSSTTVGSMADQIVAEIEDGLAHQRHKWAAQCQAHGLSMTHFHVLALLDADGPTPMSRLADQLGVAFSNLTGIVSRMEERGIVERVHDAEDRRVVLAQLTPTGRDVVHKVEATRTEHMRQLVNALTSEEQRALLGAFKTLTTAHARLHAAHDSGQQDHDTNHEEHFHS